MANSYYQRKATIDFVNSKKPEALRRDEHTDYTSGYFFVTLTVRDHKPLLGVVTGQIDPHTHQAIHAGVRLSSFGEKVQSLWQEIPQFRSNVQIIDSVVMPEHFHGLLHLNHVDGVTLGHIIKGFKLGCNQAYKEIYSLPTAAIFSSGYNETIPITPDEIAIKKQYIHDNPTRRLLKGQLRDCFTIYRNQRSANWTEERIKRGLCWDYLIRTNPELLDSTYQQLRSHLLSTDATASFCLTYLGPRELLLSTRKLPLVCHRADDSLRDQHISAVLREARAGAVIVSAFISQKERDIRDLLLQEGCPVIEILDNGMSNAYKPFGKAFYYCAEGRLLQITPWTYLYQRDATVTRPMCMVMNELARLIAGVEDDWWKKAPRSYVHS